MICSLPDGSIFSQWATTRLRPPGEFSLMVPVCSLVIMFSLVVIVTAWQGDLSRAFSEGGVGEKVNFTDL